MTLRGILVCLRTRTSFPIVRLIVAMIVFLATNTATAQVLPTPGYNGHMDGLGLCRMDTTFSAHAGVMTAPELTIPRIAGIEISMKGGTESCWNT